MSGIPEISPQRFQQLFLDSVPHHRVLALSVKNFAAGRVAYTMPYAEGLIGNPETGEIHESALVTLMDAVCAGAVQTRLGKFHRSATLDLRIDFLRASRRGEAITGEAECLHQDTNTATVRGFAHDGDPGDPLALATATFAVIGLRLTKPAA